jgi:hypothetical protein
VNSRHLCRLCAETGHARFADDVLAASTVPRPRRSQLDALIAEEHTLETQDQLSALPGREIVAEWAKNLDVLLRNGSAQQRKPLLRKLIKELTRMSRNQILPTYRIPALVRAPGHQVDLRGVEPLTSPVRAEEKGDFDDGH